LLALTHTAEQRSHYDDVIQDGIFSSVTMRDVPPRNKLGRICTNIGVAPVAAFHREYPNFSQQLSSEVKQLISANNIDVAYVFDPWADLWFSEASKLVPTLLDVCDCRSLFYERRLERADLSVADRLRTKQLLRRFNHYETAALQTYPLSTVVSPLDKQALEKLHPGCRVEIIPNGVDLEMFQPVPEISEVDANLIIFGNMDFLPNYDAAIHFANDIFPLVKGRHPNATFTIVGTNPLPEVLDLAKIEGVEVTGRVDDLKPYIQRAAMLVAPMRFGAGIKNKVLEAMAVEKPVVTNSMGVEAMHPQVRELLVIADDHVSFADKVCGLLDNEQRRRDLGKRGREVMADIHSWETAASQYESLFEELARSSRL
ncbi:MAG: glycosyltransferase, partial [Planctomycetota bacterium]|jgi:glycosyltransferase involved in cell wall biosynthesis|nr:glycosyltransferase [Planctomycetota bacterium]